MIVENSWQFRPRVQIDHLSVWTDAVVLTMTRTCNNIVCSNSSFLKSSTLDVVVKESVYSSVRLSVGVKGLSFVDPLNHARCGTADLRSGVLKPHYVVPSRSWWNSFCNNYAWLSPTRPRLLKFLNVRWPPNGSLSLWLSDSNNNGLGLVLVCFSLTVVLNFVCGSIADFDTSSVHFHSV